MGKLKSEEEIAKGIWEYMKNRNITNEESYFNYLSEQKEVKKEKSEARMKEAIRELEVIEKMRKGKL